MTPTTSPIPISQVNPPAGVLDSLELDVETGFDNLNASSALNVVVQVNLDGQILNLQENAVNQGAEWATGSLHSVLLQFPPNIGVGAVTQITLDTQFSGGTFSDNWDVTGVTVQADVVPDTSGCGVSSAKLLDLDASHFHTLSDGHQGLVRMVGGAPQTFPLSTATVPVAKRNKVVTGLYLSVGTTEDDLRGGSSLEDNANAVLNLSGGGSVTFPNINQNHELAQRLDASHRGTAQPDEPQLPAAADQSG